MTEKINQQLQTKRFSLSIGLIFLVGLFMLGGCNKIGAGSSTTPGPGTVIKNSLGMEFAYVPAGSFQMGKDKFELPVHQVTFAHGFYMGRYEVTQAQGQKIMGSNLSDNKKCGENCPVEEVSWDDAQEFVKKLNAANDGYQYRLPSEAEWEYACRAGTTGDYAGDPDAMAWYMKNSGNTTHPVGQKQPNAWGLYDMHGNVLELTADYWHENYTGAPADGSAWVNGGDQKLRALRGGEYLNDVGSTASSFRGYVTSSVRNDDQGLRLVAAPQP